MVAQKKQRVELKAHPVTAVHTLVGGSGLAAASVQPVGEPRVGSITLWDRAKAYYHTIFAALSAVAVLVIEFGPDITRQELVPNSIRHWITLAVVVANLIVTRAKSNEVWVPAASPPIDGP